MVTNFANDIIMVIRPSYKSVRGTILPDWDNATEHEVEKCSFQPGGSSLSLDGRVLGLTDGATCYCPYDADIREGDRIRFDGKTYTIDGVPRKWRSPSGQRSHIMLNLEAWSG